MVGVGWGGRRPKPGAKVPPRPPGEAPFSRALSAWLPSTPPATLRDSHTSSWQAVPGWVGPVALNLEFQQISFLPSFCPNCRCFLGFFCFFSDS